MRLLSNIIKGVELERTQPRRIEIHGADLPGKKGGELSEALPEVEEPLEAAEHLQKESEIILQETELMIKELLDRAGEEARVMMSAAHDEADLIKSEALREAAALKQKAREEGFQQGLTEAREKMMAEEEQAAVQIQNTLEEARQNKLRIMRSCEAEMLRLVMAVSRKVVAGEVHVNPEIISNVIHEALQLLDRPENVRVHVNPADVERVLANIGGEMVIGRSGERLDIAVCGDTRVDMGGCMLESDAGVIDARLETRLAVAEEALQEVTADE